MQSSGIPRAKTLVQDLLRDRNLDVAEVVAAAAEELGSTSASIALAWVASRPGITSVILGPRTVEQLHKNLQALEIELPSEIADRLERASRHTALLPVNGADNPTRSSES